MISPEALLFPLPDLAEPDAALPGVPPGVYDEGASLGTTIKRLTKGKGEVGGKSDLSCSWKLSLSPSPVLTAVEELDEPISPSPSSSCIV